MSRHELVDAYIAQIISRREFVQGLTALVVSAGVAAAYAVALQPVAAGDGNGGGTCADLYPPGTEAQPDLYELYCNGGGSGSGGTGDTGSSDDGGKKKKKKRKKKKKK